VAAALNISKATVTRAMDRLTEARLARRTDDPKGQRSVHLVLLPPG
jgi:DNA-binding MarR family transcriptional regulator